MKYLSLRLSSYTNRLFGGGLPPKGIAITQESGFYSPLFPNAALKMRAIRKYPFAFCLALGKIG